MGNFSKLLWFSELLASVGVHRPRGFPGWCDGDGVEEGGGMSVVWATGSMRTALKGLSFLSPFVSPLARGRQTASHDSV